MKKVLLVLFVALLVLPMNAQVIRKGNTYFVDEQRLNKNEFKSYMQANAEAALAAQYKRGYIDYAVGWSLFSVGTLEMALGGLLYVSSMNSQYVYQSSDKFVSFMGTTTITSFGVLLGAGLMVVGAGIDIAGITCLGVGYSRMHKSADTFIATKQDKPQAYLSLQASQNGLGLALHF